MRQNVSPSGEPQAVRLLKWLMKSLSRRNLMEGINGMFAVLILLGILLIALIALPVVIIVMILAVLLSFGK
jgi:hypothetical protein